MDYKQGNKVLYPDRTTIRRAAMHLEKCGFIMIRPYKNKTWFYPCLEMIDITKPERGGLTESDISFLQQKAEELEEDSRQASRMIEKNRLERHGLSNF